MSKELELGLDTFGDVTHDEEGRPLAAAQVIRNVVDEGVLADEVGVDFFGVGEHHRADFAVSAPDVVLAGIAARTSRIRLGSAVTVLSSDDPVRVFQRFSTVDAISKGRAEIIVGRGSFTESFPLFGFDLQKYETLFEERLDLLVRLLEHNRSGSPVMWRGATRPSLQAESVMPPTESRRLTTWVGVGGTPQSVVRAARYGLPLVLAIIGGEPRRFAGLVSLYQRELRVRGIEQLPIAAHSPGYIAESDDVAREEFWLPYKSMRDRIGAERGWPPMRRGEFESEIERGSLYVGSPETVARKIAATARELGLARFDLKYSAGPLAHSKMMRCIELYGREVIPRVRELLREQ